MNAEKLRRLQSQVRIGGKGTPRRKKKVMHQSAATDDKKLQSSLKKLSVSTIPGIEEVNIIKDDLTVIHFNNPKAQASLSANTFAVTGHGETKKIVEMLPEILPQLGQDTVMQLRMFANTMSGTQAGKTGNAVVGSVAEDDEVPMLVNDFEEVAKMDEAKLAKAKGQEELDKNKENTANQKVDAPNAETSAKNDDKLDKKGKKQQNKQSANGAAKNKPELSKNENKQQQQQPQQVKNEKPNKQETNTANVAPAAAEKKQNQAPAKEKDTHVQKDNKKENPQQSTKQDKSNDKKSEEVMVKDQAKLAQEPPVESKAVPQQQASAPQKQPAEIAPQQQATAPPKQTPSTEGRSAKPTNDNKVQPVVKESDMKVQANAQAELSKDQKVETAPAPKAQDSTEANLQVNVKEQPKATSPQPTNNMNKSASPQPPKDMKKAASPQPPKDMKKAASPQPQKEGLQNQAVAKAASPQPQTQTAAAVKDAKTEVKQPAMIENTPAQAPAVASTPEKVNENHKPETSVQNQDNSPTSQPQVPVALVENASAKVDEVIATATIEAAKLSPQTNTATAKKDEAPAKTPNMAKSPNRAQQTKQQGKPAPNQQTKPNQQAKQSPPKDKTPNANKPAPQQKQSGPPAKKPSNAPTTPTAEIPNKAAPSPNEATVVKNDAQKKQPTPTPTAQKPTTPTESVAAKSNNDALKADGQKKQPAPNNQSAQKQSAQPKPNNTKPNNNAKPAQNSANAAGPKKGPGPGQQQAKQGAKPADNKPKQPSPPKGPQKAPAATQPQKNAS